MFRLRPPKLRMGLMMMTGEDNSNKVKNMNTKQLTIEESTTRAYCPSCGVLTTSKTGRECEFCHKVFCKDCVDRYIDPDYHYPFEGLEWSDTEEEYWCFDCEQKVLANRERKINELIRESQEKDTIKIEEMR